MKIKAGILVAVLLSLCSCNNVSSKKEISSQKDAVDKYDYVLSDNDKVDIEISYGYFNETFDNESCVGKFAIDEEIENLCFNWDNVGKLEVTCLGAFNDINLTRINYSCDNFHFSFPIELSLKYDEKGKNNNCFPKSVYAPIVLESTANYFNYIYMSFYDVNYDSNDTIIINKVSCTSNDVNLSNFKSYYLKEWYGILNKNDEYIDVSFPYQLDINFEKNNFALSFHYEKNKNYFNEGCDLIFDLTINGENQISYVCF